MYMAESSEPRYVLDRQCRGSAENRGKILQQAVVSVGAGMDKLWGTGKQILKTSFFATSWEVSGEENSHALPLKLERLKILVASFHLHFSFSANTQILQY